MNTLQSTWQVATAPDGCLAPVEMDPAMVEWARHVFYLGAAAAWNIVETAAASPNPVVFEAMMDTLRDELTRHAAGAL